MGYFVMKIPEGFILEAPTAPPIPEGFRIEAITPTEATPYITEEGSQRPLEFSPFLMLEPLRRLGDYLGVTDTPDYREDSEGNRITRIDELAAAWDQGSADIGRLSRATEAFAPTSVWVDAEGNDLGPVDSPSATAYSYMEGARLMSPRERYSDAFVDTMSVQERIQAIEKRRVSKAQERHANTLAVQTEIGKNTTLDTIGNVVVELGTPTSAIPVGRAIKTMVGTGSAIAGSSELTRQITSGDYDLKTLGLHTAAGSLLTPVVAAPIRSTKAVANQAKNTVNYVTNKTKALASKAGSTKAANSVVSKMNDKIADKVVANVPEAEIIPAVLKEMGLKNKDALVVYNTSTIGAPIIPTLDDAAKVVAVRNNPLASTTMIGKAWDELMAPLQQVIRLNSQKIGNLMREYEYRSAVNTADTQTKTQPFLEYTTRLLKKEKNPEIKAKYLDFQDALNNGQFKTALKISDEYFPQISKQFRKSKEGKEGTLVTLLDDIHKRALASGMKIGRRVNFFPRVIKDLEGIQEAVGTAGVSIAEKALAKIAKKKGVEVDELDDNVVSEVYNRIIAGSKTGLPTKRTGASRTIQEVTPKLREFYHDAPTALTIYTQRMEKEIAKRQFFNQQNSLKKAEGTDTIDLSGSIGEMLAKMRRNGELNHVQEDNLRALLTARFEGGETAMNGTLAKVRDIQYMATLANFRSATIQLADVGSSVYVNGLGNTIKEIATGIKGSRLKPEDIGLLNRTSMEFGTTDGFSKALDATMRGSLFTKIDRSGKRIFINASYAKYQKIAQKNPDAFVKKWDEVFGDDTVKLMETLQKGEIDDNVKLMLWNELSEVQPISLSEMPAAYLNSPNGRVFFAMKSYMLKQLGLVRKDIVEQYRKGNKSEALVNAARYSLIMGTANATVQDVRNYVKSGFDTEGMTVDFTDASTFADTASDAWVQSLMDIMFLSKYQKERHLENGDWGQFVATQLMPASIGLTDMVGKAASEVSDDSEQDYEAVKKVVTKLPIFGQDIYTFMLGGAEKTIEKKREREAQQRRKDRLKRAMQ
tara:strand:+ start:937 stop:4062 length:3126 start_codon:yes stop_codon:yes gene_type:complete